MYETHEVVQTIMKQMQSSMELMLHNATHQNMFHTHTQAFAHPGKSQV